MGNEPESLLPTPKAEKASGSEGPSQVLTIGQYHYHGNDIAELRKLAEVSPQLAEKVVDQRDKEDARVNISYRFGLAVSLLLVAFTLTAFTVAMIFAGVWATLIAVAAILAVALLVRVILTGKWSDTSWFGKLVTAIARALGASETDLKNGE